MCIVDRLAELATRGNATIDDPLRNRPPIGGWILDNKLKLDMLTRHENGLVINNEVLRSGMLVLLSNAGKSYLVSHAGALGPSWAQRFWVRHNFPVRKGTTKMRVPKPQDAENLQTYLDVITEVS